MVQLLAVTATVGLKSGAFQRRARVARLVSEATIEFGAPAWGGAASPRRAPISWSRGRLRHTSCRLLTVHAVAWAQAAELPWWDPRRAKTCFPAERRLMKPRNRAGASHARPQAGQAVGGRAASLGLRAPQNSLAAKQMEAGWWSAGSPGTALSDGPIRSAACRLRWLR